MAEPSPNRIADSLHICPAVPLAAGAADLTEVDAFDEQLDLGADELADELRSLAHANMSLMAETFIIALRNDLIGADDFLR